ncbi:MAG: DUF58 domain-containing protein [Bacteroidetes bacterium]|nr:DUF58 domain-containing protein [Bacteroidota bacterium]
MTISQNPLIENLELIARQVVEGFIIGLHKSPFHGFSVEFAEHRLYNHGDALRHVDWKVYGRTDKLFVKKYEEETNLRCCLLVDTSASMHFPKEEGKYSKLEFSCIAAASILQLLKRQLDAASLALFNQELYYFSDCRSAHSHYRLLTHELEKTLKKNPENQKTNAVAALHQVAEQMHKRSLVIVFSDMIDDAGNTEELFSALQHLKYNKHEVILFHVMDGTKEVAFDYENRPYEFVDMESGERIKLQPHQVKDVYTQSINIYMKDIADKCLKYHIDFVPVDLTKPVERVLYSFLLKRNKLL